MLFFLGIVHKLRAKSHLVGAVVAIRVGHREDEVYSDGLLVLVPFPAGKRFHWQRFRCGFRIAVAGEGFDTSIRRAGLVKPNAISSIAVYRKSHSCAEGGRVMCEVATA